MRVRGSRDAARLAGVRTAGVQHAATGTQTDAQSATGARGATRLADDLPDVARRLWHFTQLGPAETRQRQRQRSPWSGHTHTALAANRYSPRHALPRCCRACVILGAPKAKPSPRRRVRAGRKAPRRRGSPKKQQLWGKGTLVGSDSRLRAHAPGPGTCDSALRTGLKNSTRGDVVLNSPAAIRAASDSSAEPVEVAEAARSLNKSSTSLLSAVSVSSPPKIALHATLPRCGPRTTGSRPKAGREHCSLEARPGAPERGCAQSCALGAPPRCQWSRTRAVWR